MKVRPLEPQDVCLAAEVEQVAWGDAAASMETIAGRARVFAPGSIVVEQDGRVVGYAAAQLTDHLSTLSWADQTDEGRIAQTHIPDGKLAYGVSMSARPGVGGAGVAAEVVGYYAKLFLGGGCRALCVGSRLPGYRRWAQDRTDAALGTYLSRGESGEPRDPEMRLYARLGFRLLWEMPGYYPDPESGGHGAMMVRTAA